MATPSAVLSILVQADTTKATAAIKTFDRTVGRTSTTSKSATANTTALNKATGTLGSSLGRAARYASGAAAAYLSIAQAKQAITVTQDLAKTTAGLNRNLGLSTKRASQWGTVARARDIDAKSLTMSFTTLSRRLTDVSKGSDTAIDSFKDIGVSQRELTKTGGDFNQQLLLVADAFGEAEGGAVRQQAAQKLLGRGYQTLLPLFAEGSKSLQEQMMWADKYGTTLNDKALKAQMDLVTAQRESKVALMGLQVSFTKFLTPALQVANEEFQKIARIMGSDKLTNDEKFKRVGNIIEKWGSKALDGFVKVLPGMVEAAGKAAPKIAGAFVQGFLNSDAAGKLAIGSILFAKFGGVTAAGTALGGKFGKAFGPAAAAFFGFALLDFLFKHKDEITAAFQGKTTYSSHLMEEYGIGAKRADAISKITQQQGPISFEDASELLKAQKTAQERFTKIAEDGAKDRNQIADQALRDLQVLYSKSNEKTKDGFESTRSKLNSVTKRQAGDVAGNVANMVNAVGEGLRKLGTNTNNALKAFGAKKIAFSIADVGSAASDVMGKQRGGPIDIGAPSGDSVPAMLERGEYVLNRNAVNALGKGTLDKINFGVAKRFQRGGHANLGRDVVSRSATGVGDLFPGQLPDSTGLPFLPNDVPRNNAGQPVTGLGGYMPGVNFQISGNAGYDPTLPSLKGDVFVQRGAPLEGEVWYFGHGPKGNRMGGTYGPFGRNGETQAPWMPKGFDLLPLPGGALPISPSDLSPEDQALLGGLGSERERRRGVGSLGRAVTSGFQKGGLVRKMATGGLIQALGPYSIPPIQYDSNHAGGNSHWHIHMSSTPAVVSVGKQLQGMGFQVSEHPAFGGVNFQHSATGGHYDALSIDVNSAADETREETAKVAALLSGKGGATAAAFKKLKRMMLNGPAGPLKDMGQGSLDKSWKAANAYLKSKAPSVTGGNSSYSADGEVERVFAEVAKKFSAHREATKALGEAGYHESGMRDLNYGDADSQGALQYRTSIWGTQKPHDEGWIAHHFLTQGATGTSANSMKGSPAHVIASAVQGNATGTGVYAAEAGRAEAWMKKYGLQVGGMARKLPFAGSYAKGGTVPGPIGAPAMAMVHGGETITPPGATPKVDVYVTVSGNNVDVATEVNGRLAESNKHVRQLARMHR